MIDRRSVRVVDSSTCSTGSSTQLGGFGKIGRVIVSLARDSTANIVSFGSEVSNPRKRYDTKTSRLINRCFMVPSGDLRKRFAEALMTALAARTRGSKAPMWVSGS